MAIPSAPGFEASSFGRIRAVTRRGPSPAYHILMSRIRTYRGNVPYAGVRLLSADGKRKERRVNRLVCEAFNGPPITEAHHAAHDDGNSLNNLPGNLYWASPQQNIDDRERHGRTARGSANGFAKLTESDVRRIRELIAEGFVQMDIGKQFNVSNHAICSIKRGKTWKHV